MNKDMHNNVKVLNAFDIQSISSDTTTNGDIIDLQGFQSCEFIFQTGTITDGDYTVLIHEGDDSGLSDAAAVSDSDLLGTESDASFSENDDDNKVSKIGYLGTKRYVRFNVVSANTTSGGTVGAVAVLGSPSQAPVS